MAANRASAQQGLTIALIVFVMLTFILAVTTYLFFKKAADADAAMAVANADSAKSKQACSRFARRSRQGNLNSVRISRMCT